MWLRASGFRGGKYSGREIQIVDGASKSIMTGSWPRIGTEMGFCIRQRDGDVQAWKLEDPFYTHRNEKHCNSFIYWLSNRPRPCIAWVWQANILFWFHAILSSVATERSCHYEAVIHGPHGLYLEMTHTRMEESHGIRLHFRVNPSL